ncbi:hypothetical protein AVEN_103604-1 [Araneus ventricosus]|uniref:Uncharacterized protein n=1 Tax=Araneus ventricosus TaxID=182803 RepID=A0A4Y2V3A8_ARAVE|nr:hypothetical protein AVEN_103604-1 [Araneus ventricosus]
MKESRILSQHLWIQISSVTKPTNNMEDLTRIPFQEAVGMLLQIQHVCESHPVTTPMDTNVCTKSTNNMEDLTRIPFQAVVGMLRKYNMHGIHPVTTPMIQISL